MSSRVTPIERPAALPPADARLVVVEANAGTGKTFFLEHRVADLVLAGAELTHLLLVTFTEKAVAELRTRIRDLLDRLVRADPATVVGWTIDDAARARLRVAISQFDHAPIFTIHGFCHRILVEDAFAAQRLFVQTQVADEVAFDAAFGALLRERFARLSPDRELLAAFLATDRTVDKLRTVLLGCARAGVDARVRRRLDPEAVGRAAGAMRAQFASESRRNIVLAALASERRWVTDWLAHIAHALERCPDDAPAPRLVAMLDELRAQASYLAKRADRLPREFGDALRAACASITLDEAVASHFLPALLARIGDDKAERGMFDYDDMLQLVWRALCGPRRELLAARLRSRTPWAMIDEFQDTDPVQWNIFRTVWLHPSARGLTIVGDPKQAIYSFRGADVHTYLAARDELVRGGAARVALTVNRRSSAPLVAAVNQILVGNPLMPLLDKSITYDAPVSASGDLECNDPRPSLTIFALRSIGKGQTDANRVALAVAIGDAIDGLRAAPPQWRLRGVEQPFRLGQIMVLGRTNRDATEIAAALRARGSPCSLVEPERLFATREASELVSLLAAVAAPRDRSARLRALRTRFFDVPWAALQPTVDAPDHHPMIARIFEWAQLAGRRHYEALFRRIVEDSRFAERALVLGGGERALTNTWHLIELLLVEVARSRCDLHELVHVLRRWIADDSGHPDERDIQRSETDGDTIRVLTIHKAKGLEAPYVFLYGGTSGGPKGGIQLVRDARSQRTIVVGTPDEDTQRAIDDESDAENQRLAYVALTRAQLRLYLPHYGEFVLQKQSAYHPIQRCIAGIVAAHARGSATGVAVVPVAVGGEATRPPPHDALARLALPAVPEPATRAPLVVARRGLTMVSYTRLAHDLDAAMVRLDDSTTISDRDDGDGGRAKFVDVPVGPGELPAGPASGLLLHDVLEHADLVVARAAHDAATWAAVPTVAARFAAAARARGVATEYLPHATELAFSTLTAPLVLTDGDVLPPLVAADRLAREIEFAYPLPPPARGLVKGFIDALVVYGNDLWVLDYKSDTLEGSDLSLAAAHRVREHYAIQARLYALAAARLGGNYRLCGMLYSFVRYSLPLADDPARRGVLTVAVRTSEPASLAAWSDWLARIATSDVVAAPDWRP